MPGGSFRFVRSWANQRTGGMTIGIFVGVAGTVTTGARGCICRGAI